MTPDYEYKGKCHIRFFNCDNMEFMKEVEDKEYAIGLVDPPYGIDITGQFENANKDGTKSMFKKTKGIVKKSWDNEIPTFKYFDELKRIKKVTIFNETLVGAHLYYNRVGGKKMEHGRG